MKYKKCTKSSWRDRQRPGPVLVITQSDLILIWFWYDSEEYKGKGLWWFESWLHQPNLVTKGKGLWWFESWSHQPNRVTKKNPIEYSHIFDKKISLYWQDCFRAWLHFVSSSQEHGIVCTLVKQLLQARPRLNWSKATSQQASICRYHRGWVS